MNQYRSQRWIYGMNDLVKKLNRKIHGAYSCPVMGRLTDLTSGVAITDNSVDVEIAK
jgi:hypothetical protein